MVLEHLVCKNRRVPELPDVTVYVERIAERVTGHRLEQLRLKSPFVLRTAVPPIADAEGKIVTGVRRVGKRIVLALEGERYIVCAPNDRGQVSMAYPA